MAVITDIGEFMANSFSIIWNAMGTWGVIGVGIIGTVILRKIANLLKQVFQF